MSKSDFQFCLLARLGECSSLSQSPRSCRTTCVYLSLSHLSHCIHH